MVLNCSLLHHFPCGSDHLFFFHLDVREMRLSVFRATLETDKDLFDYVLQFGVHPNSTFK